MMDEERERSHDHKRRLYLLIVINAASAAFFELSSLCPSKIGVRSKKSFDHDVGWRGWIVETLLLILYVFMNSFIV